MTGERDALPFLIWKGNFMKRLRFLPAVLLFFLLTFPVCANDEIRITVSCEGMDGTVVLEEDGIERDRRQVAAGTASGFILKETEPGIRTYTVRQLSAEGMDDTVYYVDVYTVLEDDVLKSEPVIYVKDSSAKLDTCRFVNEAPETPKESEKPAEVTESVTTEPTPSNILERIKTGESGNLLLCLCAGAMFLSGIFLIRKKRKDGERL